MHELDTKSKEDHKKDSHKHNEQKTGLQKEIEL